jgi:hypothetical protein
MEDDTLEEKLIGKITINVYADNTFNVGTSLSLDDTLELLDAAIYSIENNELEGLDDFKQFGGTIQ